MNPSESRILIVDDEQTNIAVLERLLAWAGYAKVCAASDGEQALMAVKSFQPDLIVLDLHMPGMDGYQTLHEIRARQAPEEFLPVVAYTADATREARERALSLGANDFLTKPAERTELKLRFANLLMVRSLHEQLRRQNVDLDVLVRARTRELEQAQVEIVERLARAGEFRDEDTGEHTRRVGELARRISEVLGLPDTLAELIGLAAPLHDIGKIGIADGLLLKPGRLTEEEYREMKLHTFIGSKILSNSSTPLLQTAERIALSHHERWDGTGYPAGLAGDAIPIEGRIVAVADVFDALTHERPYKEAWTVSAAIEHIQLGAGSQFDPSVVQAFLEVLDGESEAAA